MIERRKKKRSLYDKAMTPFHQIARKGINNILKYMEEQKMAQKSKEIPIEIVFIERIVTDYIVVLNKQTMSEVDRLKATVDLQKAMLRTVCGVVDGMKKQGSIAIPSFTQELAEELNRVRQGMSPKICTCNPRDEPWISPTCPRHGIHGNPPFSK